VDVLRFPVGDAALVRVPYVDVLVDAEVVGLTPDLVAASAWAQPTWAEGDQVRVGAAVWIIQSDGRRIVVDPTQAADGILRTGSDAAVHQEAVAGALTAAGFPRESIDTVIASHIDGIGMIAWRDDERWTPFFPNAEVLLSERELAAIADDGPYEPQGGDALLELDRQGAVRAIGDEHAVTSEVSTTWVGEHSPGHLLVDVTSGDETATLIGHLALSPVHCVSGEPGPHLNPAGAARLLQRLGDGRRTLVGPLWPAPGAIRWSGSEVTTVEPDAAVG
jgi:hypothetical protein